MVLPVPGLPEKTRCRETGTVRRPFSLRSFWVFTRFTSSRTSFFTAERPISSASCSVPGFSGSFGFSLSPPAGVAAVFGASAVSAAFAAEALSDVESESPPCEVTAASAVELSEPVKEAPPASFAGDDPEKSGYGFPRMSVLAVFAAFSTSSAPARMFCMLERLKISSSSEKSGAFGVPSPDFVLLSAFETLLLFFAFCFSSSESVFGSGSSTPGTPPPSQS